MEECLHGMEDPAWCSICKHGPEKAQPEKIDYAFDARYDGECPECDLPITIGQHCVRTTQGRTLHRRCA
jgi:hypothetical protein